MTGCLLGRGDTLISMPGFSLANGSSECLRNALWHKSARSLDQYKQREMTYCMPFELPPQLQ